MSEEKLNPEDNTPNPQTINVKDIQKQLKDMQEQLEKLQPEADPKGLVEGVVPSIKPEDAVGKKILDAFREYLGNEDKKTFEISEAIGAVSAGSAKPSIWSAEPELLSPAGAVGYFLTSIVKWKEDVKGKPGQQVYVQTVAAVAAAVISSGSEPTFTASTISSVPVTLVQRGHGFYVTKDDLDDMQDGTMEEMVTQSKNSILREIDGYFLTSIQALAGNAAAGTLNESCIMAATILAKMWGSLMAGSYVPAAVVLHPVQYASLLQDDQFTDASKLGSSTVISTGNIPNYLGMDIVPLVQGTLKAATGGTYRAFMMAKGALVGAIKRDLGFEKEYYVKDQRQYNVASIRFGGTVVHTSGIGLITTVNG